MSRGDLRYVLLEERLAEPDEGITQMYVEVGDDGTVQRELGLDTSGSVVHRTPSDAHRHGERGFWDLVTVPTDLGTDVPAAEFERMWAAPDGPIPVSPPRANVLGRLRHWVSHFRKLPPHE